MIDVIKKTVLAGIGATVVTKEKVETLLQDWVKQGKVSAQEAGEFASKIAADGKREFEATSQELGAKFKELLARADFAPKAQVRELEERIRQLEAKLAEMTRPPAA